MKIKPIYKQASLPGQVDGPLFEQPETGCCFPLVNLDSCQLYASPQNRCDVPATCQRQISNVTFLTCDAHAADVDRINNNIAEILSELRADRL